MSDATPRYNVEEVCAGLARAWAFLRGEERVFALGADLKQPPVLTEFSYFMPLKHSDDHRVSGLGVLIQRPDAMEVAAHMFGMNIDQLQEADLHDACAEVCNLFSGCMALHINASVSTQMGLPFRASSAMYQQIAADSTVAAVFVSSTANAQLHVVEYDIFNQPH